MMNSYTSPDVGSVPAGTGYVPGSLNASRVNWSIPLTYTSVVTKICIYKINVVGPVTLITVLNPGSGGKYVYSPVILKAGPGWGSNFGHGTNPFGLCV